MGYHNYFIDFLAEPKHLDLCYVPVCMYASLIWSPMGHNFYLIKQVAVLKGYVATYFVCI